MSRTEKQIANVKRYREKHRDRLLKEGRQSYKTDSKKYKYLMYKRAEKRAKCKSIPFSIDISDIDIPDVCPILGIPLKIGSGRGPSDHSPSLDRIDPKLGYVKGNVIVISMKANKIKSDALLEDIEKVVLFLKLQSTK